MGEASEKNRSALGSLAFFFVLAGYYILRPLRDELGIRSGVEHLDWMFSATFAVTLVCMVAYAWLSARVSRYRIISMLYIAVVLSLLGLRIFYSDNSRFFTHALFVWISVINIFLVSGFWAVMIDSFDSGAATRRFGKIAAGGTAGALTGPTITSLLSQYVATEDLLLIAAGCIGVANGVLAFCPPQLKTTKTEFIAQATFADFGRLMADSRLRGLCVMVILYGIVNTFVYLLQVQIVAKEVTNSTDRITLFSNINLTVNMLTIVIQIFVTQYLLRVKGVIWCICLLPATTAIGFAGLSFWPTLWATMTLTILLRTTRFAINRPAREILFTWMPDTDRYRSRTTMDTLSYRASDAIGAWFVSALNSVGFGTVGIAGVGMSIAYFWCWLSKETASRICTTSSTIEENPQYERY